MAAPKLTNYFKTFTTDPLWADLHDRDRERGAVQHGQSRDYPVAPRSRNDDGQL
jgi:hypothetical protein